MYVKPEVRKGLLGRMLVELLETRVMVKQAMKGVKEDKVSFVECPKLLPEDLVILGPETHSGCSTARTKVHRKCYVWLHQRDILWSNACCRDRRQHCSKRS